VVVLHELGGSAATFRWLSACLPDLRVVALDLPGTGTSPPLEGEPTLEALARRVREELVEHLGGRPAVVVGVAGGAAVAAALAASDPDEVAALVYCSLGAGLPDETVGYLRDRVPVVREHGMAEVVDSSLARSFPESLRVGREDLYAEYRADFVASDVRGYVDQQLALASGAGDLAGLLARVAAPAFVLGGQLDELFPPPTLDAAAALLPHLVARVDLPGVAHLPHLQAPEALAATIELAVAVAVSADAGAGR
jgi:pimeloyl-ACP methyl ester carboxylesterase